MKIVAILLLTLLRAATVRGDNRLIVGDFSQNNLTGWKTESFKNQTEYSLQTLDRVTVLRAISNQAASGLYKEQHIDLNLTPFLNWSWRVANRMEGLNEQSKAGDDYPARVYVIVSGGLAFWRTRAVNYVWTGNSAKGSIWPNAFAGEHAMMVAVRGPEAPLNTWLHEKRDVRADLNALFGEDIRFIDAVALMTDTDNSGGQVSAFYGDIWFSKD